MLSKAIKQQILREIGRWVWEWAEQLFEKEHRFLDVLGQPKKVGLMPFHPTTKNLHLSFV